MLKPLPVQDVRIGHETFNGRIFRESDPPVYILKDGRFAVYYQNKWQAKKTLGAIDKLLSSTRKYLKMFSSGNPPAVAEIADMLKSKMVGADGKPVYSRWSTWYVWNEEAYTKLVAFREKERKVKQALEEEEERILDGLKKVSEDNFKKLLKAAHSSDPQIFDDDDGEGDD